MAKTIRLKVSKNNSITECLNVIGNKVDNGDEWYYLPFWFKHIGDGIYELYVFDELPDHLKKTIQENRMSNPQK